MVPASPHPKPNTNTFHTHRMEVCAMSLVNISLVGNLVKPPEQMYFASGRVKTSFIVAINKKPGRGKSLDTADFYRVETWGKLAELAGQYQIGRASWRERVW